jgi:hypothetical protein
MARDWTLAGAFDAGHIRGGTPNWEKELDFHQLEATGHDLQLEEDYKLLREEFGLRLFRDGAWLGRSMPAPGVYDWAHLDRLASLSHGEVWLSLCHYEWPVWATEEDLFNGRVVEAMAEFGAQVALRYRGCFAGYVPTVEIGYWTAMMTDWARWWPARKGLKERKWWDLYAVTARMMTRVARAVKNADPSVPIALNEPWAWHPHMPLKDQGRPFSTLLGRSDPIAERELGSDDLGGAPDLLQVVGINFYNNWGEEQGWPLSRLLLEARRQFPDQGLMMGETGNCHFSECFTVPAWLGLLDRQVAEANAQGADVEAVTWAPVLTLADFDWGHPAPGAWVTWSKEDPSRKRSWNPESAKYIRDFQA